MNFPSFSLMNSLILIFVCIFVSLIWRIYKVHSSRRKLSLKTKSLMLTTNRNIPFNNFLEVINRDYNGKIPFEEYEYNQHTLLINASSNKRCDIVKYLLDKGCNPNQKDSHNKSALHYAAYMKSLDISKELIDHGAFLDEFDDFGYSPMIYAIHRNSKEIIKLLFNKGVKIKILDRERLQIERSKSNYKIPTRTIINTRLMVLQKMHPSLPKFLLELFRIIN